MDDCDGSPYKGLIATVRKKRSQTPRRPKTGNLTATGSHEQSPGSLLSSKSAQPFDASQSGENLILKDKSSEDSPPADKKSGLKGISYKDFLRGIFGASKSDVEKMSKKNALKKQGEKRRENLNIQRRPRKRLILKGLDEDEDDDEIHYSEKLKLKANKNEMLEDVESSGKEVKRISNQGFDQYTDYEEQLLSND